MDKWSIRSGIFCQGGLESDSNEQSSKKGIGLGLEHANQMVMAKCTSGLRVRSQERQHVATALYLALLHARCLAFIQTVDVNVVPRTSCSGSVISGGLRRNASSNTVGDVPSKTSKHHRRSKTSAHNV